MLLLVDQYIFKFVFRKSLTLCLEFPSSVHLKGDTPWRLFLNSIHYDLFWFVYLIFYGLSGSNSIWRSFAKTQSWNVSFAPLCPSMILLLFNLIILLFSCGQFCVRPISVERGQGRWEGLAELIEGEDGAYVEPFSCLAPTSVTASSVETMLMRMLASVPTQSQLGGLGETLPFII